MPSDPQEVRRSLREPKHNGFFPGSWARSQTSRFNSFSVLDHDSLLGFDRQLRDASDDSKALDSWLRSAPIERAAPSNCASPTPAAGPCMINPLGRWAHHHILNSRGAPMGLLAFVCTHKAPKTRTPATARESIPDLHPSTIHHMTQHSERAASSARGQSIRNPRHRKQARFNRGRPSSSLRRWPPPPAAAPGQPRNHVG